MTVKLSSDLASFHAFVAQKLQHNHNITPEQALAEWREHQETIESIRRGLDEVEAGRTEPAEKLLERLKGKL